MSNHNERSKVDRELRRLGFGGLDDPNLITSIAFFIKNHEQFRGQLFAVKPEERRHAYETLRPHLRFVPKPLDVYEAEMKTLAEQNQLPTYDPKTGELIPYQASHINIDLMASEAVKQKKHEDAGGTLELVCAKCTRFEHFQAKYRKDAEAAANRGGWRSDGRKNWCPLHIPTRVTMTLKCAADDCLVEEELRAWDPQDGYASARLRGWVITDLATCPKCSSKQLTLQ